MVVGPCRRHVGGAMNLPGPCDRHAAGAMVGWALAVAMPVTQPHTLIRKGHMRRPSCIVVAREAGRGRVGPCGRHVAGLHNL